MVNFRFREYFSGPLYDAGLFFCLCILVLAMPISTYAMSAIQLAMGGVWVLTGEYKKKVLRFWHNRPAVIFTLIYMVYVAGLLWSEDLAQGFVKDLRDKLPTLTLTILVASAHPLALKKARLLLLLFAFSVTITSFIGFGIFISGQYGDFRDLSPFISHFYFSLMILIAAFSLPWLAKRMSEERKVYIASLFVSGWLLFFLFIMSSLQGLLCLAGIILFLLVRLAFTGRKAAYRVSAAVVVLILAIAVAGVSAYMYSRVSSRVAIDRAAFNEKTAAGNSYTHDFENELRENGHYVFSFVAREELRQAWSTVSDYDFEGLDDTGHELYATLYRYMASKGLKKDREGLMSLSREDIEAVERGIPNHLYTRWPTFITRIHGAFWEIYWYGQTGNPTGHTLSQRLELWKASYVAFREKPLLGWGTGDVYIAVDYGLHSIGSQMEDFHIKPHNQYLVFLLIVGLAGSFLIYLFYFLYVRMTRAYQFLPFNIFLAIMAVAMLGNNPIDVQTGQTIFCFFSLFFGMMYRPFDGASDEPDL